MFLAVLVSIDYLHLNNLNCFPSPPPKRAYKCHTSKDEISVADALNVVRHYRTVSKYGLGTEPSSCFG